MHNVIRGHGGCESHSLKLTSVSPLWTTVEVLNNLKFFDIIAYKIVITKPEEKQDIVTNFPMALQPPMGPWPTSMKLSVSLRFS
jgi:hypothetical protein